MPQRYAFRFLSCFSLFILLIPCLAYGQSATTGMISGVVTDSSGAVLPGATVTLIQQATSVKQTATTGSDGRYVFAAVVPNDYELNVSAPGFETTVVSNVVVEVLKSYTVDASLKLGSVTQTVEVTEQATAELQTTSSNVGSVLGGEALTTLPVFTRSASALMFYQPAVSPSGQIAGPVTSRSLSGWMVVISLATSTATTPMPHHRANLRLLR